MRQSLTLASGPASEPISLAEVKAWARIDASDEDAILATLIAAARGTVEEYLRRSLVTQSWTLTLGLPCADGYRDLPEGVYDLPATALFGGLPRAVHLPKGPVQSVTSVVTYDTANESSTFDASNYYLDAAGERLVLNRDATWPSSLRPTAACEITYVAGYGNASAVPQPIRTALLMLTAALYETRGMCGQSALPPASQQLLKQFRILGNRRG